MDRAIIVVGLGYGDEGKGSVVDKLCRQENADLVVRFNGGAQASHNVITPEGRHHTFAQFGSGTFMGAKTLLSRYMVVNPLSLLTEATVLEGKGIASPLSLLSIDYRALITDPFQIAANRLREMTRTHRHVSCGMGVGETVSDSLSNPYALRMGDMVSYHTLVEKLILSQARKRQELLALDLPLSNIEIRKELEIIYDPEAPKLLADRYFDSLDDVDIVTDTDVISSSRAAIFEGAQGILLDEWVGFYPHTTCSTTTTENANTLLERIARDTICLGVIRAYATRHGEGPFVTQDDNLLQYVTEPHNAPHGPQGAFRVGHFDMVALDYAICCNHSAIDGIVITHVDQMLDFPEIKFCDSYRYQGEFTAPYIIPSPKDDFLAREQLTKDLIEEAEPAYISVDTVHDLIAEISHLSTMNGIGTGPTADDYAIEY